jgi:diguanylate cyclase (GGDEF)-like protein
LALTVTAVNGGFVAYYTTLQRDDARIINHGGIIRGSIQRLSKLETNDRNADHVISRVESILTDFERSRNGLHVRGNANEFFAAMAPLQAKWQDLKQAIARYRWTRSKDDRTAIVEASEQAWESANRMVFAAQVTAQRKVHKLSSMVLLLGLNPALILVIIGLTLRDVRDGLEIRASYDCLTRAYNKSAYSEFLRREVARAQRYQRPLSLVILDVDHFKRINDQFGHEAGDHTLVRLSLLIRGMVRNVDVFCRIGGEEFALILPEAPVDGATGLAERIREAVAVESFGKVASVTVSAGVTAYASGETIEDLFLRADLLLYRAKAAGRNTVLSG